MHPQGGRPVPSYTLRPEVLEAMRQGRTQFGMFGQPAQRASSSKPQIFDISMADDEDMEPNPEELQVKELALRLYKQIIDAARALKLDDLIQFQKNIENATTSQFIQEIHAYMDRPDVYGDIKGTPIMKAVKALVDDTFVSHLKKDLEKLVSMSRGPTPSASSSAVVPAQRTRAATYVSPPKPILPIADQPKSQPQKRDAEQIEGIEEREESPKSKARAKASTTKVEPDDPRALSLEEQAKATTVLNDFRKHEVKSRTSENISFVEDYLQNTIDTSEKVKKELENYIRREFGTRTEKLFGIE